MTVRSVPLVAIVAVGGAITAMSPDRLELTQSSERPQRRPIDDVLADLPELSTIAKTRTVSLADQSSSDSSLEDLARLSERVVSLSEDPSTDGIVVTHGTSALEEAAFFLALTCSSRKPIVITGATRPASALSPDGPLNLVNAVRIAAHPGAADRGVLVCLDHSILAARAANKLSLLHPNAFGSGESGALGSVEPDGSVVFRRRVEPWPTEGRFEIAEGAAMPRVDVVASYPGADGEHIRASLRAGSRGIVLAGMGAGLATPDQEAALTEAVDLGVVVCRSSRISGGYVPPVQQASSPLRVSSHGRTPWQARILIAVALASGREASQLKSYFLPGLN